MPLPPHRQPDREEIRRALELLVAEGAVVELRVLNSRQGTVSGYYTDRDRLAQDAAYWSGRAPGVYLTPNPLNPVLLARACNRWVPYAHHTTGDADVTARRWLLLDFDPDRPSGISASEPEHTLALERARSCRDWLREQGWPEGVLADSGNGGHLLYRLDLPNDDPTRDLVAGCLQALAQRFDDARVLMDRKVFNAARIWKLYGTLAAKGDSLPERPHRLSRLLEVPEALATVSREQLAALAPAGLGAGPSLKQRLPLPGLLFDLPAWIQEYQLPVIGELDWRGGKLWRLNPCPWNPAHDDRAAYLIQLATGAIAAGCHHNGCRDQDWHTLRALYEGRPRDLGTGRGAPSAGSAAADSTLVYPDLAAAERFARQLAGEVRYCHAFGKWLLRDGPGFRVDITGELERRARAFVLSLPAAPGGGELAGRIRALLELLRSAPGIPITPFEVETRTWLLPVADGVLDLRTGLIAPAERDASGPLRRLPRRLRPELPDPSLPLRPDQEELLAQARAAGYPPVRLLDWTVEGESAWRALCSHPGISPDYLAAAAAALRTAEWG